MSMQSESEAEIGFQQLAQNPPAPPDELFDISTTVDPSYVISLIRKLLPPPQPHTDSSQFATLGETNHNFLESKCEIMDGNSNDQQNHVHGNDYWEEHGCILWDLATSTTHAEFMVQNLILEVILATLMVSQSPRVTEISLGILGNLACHQVSRKQIATVKGLTEIIVDQLFVDDTPSLCEEFRLLTLCLQGSEGITWAHALQPENVISRILWIVENTLNPQLTEKSLGLVLAISESEDEVQALLLLDLVKSGLPLVLINLLAFEISKVKDLPERHSVLDIILRAIEALIVIDSYSQQLCSSKRLFNLLVTVIKLADKVEVASSCVTAAVLIANLLSDSDDLILEIKQEATNALWDLISRLLAVGETDPINLYQIISVLAAKFDLIEEDLQVASDRNLSLRTAALNRIDCIASQLLAVKDRINEYLVDERALERLKECCRKYSSNRQCPDDDD